MAATMKAAVYHGNGDIRIEQVPRPEPGAGELLLEVHAAGVCGTDAAEYTQGPTMYPITVEHPITGHVGPMIPGHEFGGRVVAWGAGVSGFAEGDLVASGAGISCGACHQCLAGKTNLCVRYATSGLQRDGGLAQYVAVPADVCHEVGSLGLTDDGAGIVQPMSIAVHSMRRGQPRAGDEVLVLGVGGVGAFVVFAAAAERTRVIAADLDAERLAIAESLGAAEVMEAPRDALLNEEFPALRGRAAVVYEVSGTRQGLAAAIEAVGSGGRVVAIGLHKKPVPVDVRAITLREIELVGTSAHAFAADVPEAARLVASRAAGWSDVAPVALPLELMVPEALIPLSQGASGRIKNLIDPWVEDIRPSVF